MKNPDSSVPASSTVGASESPVTGPFTSVSRHELQAAFGIAHKSSEDVELPFPVRRRFRAIALLIWKAHGEPGAIPPNAGAQLLEKDMLLALFNSVDR